MRPARDGADRVRPGRSEVGRPGARLMEAVRQRDPEALGELFEIYFDRLYSLAYRLVGEHARAEDVMQDVFLKVHRAAHQLDPERDPGPWLTTLTRNACREQWRRRGRRVDRHARSLDSGSSLRETLPTAYRDPEHETLRSERDRAVAEALMKLPVGLREVVVLRDYHGMAHEEIASVVGTRDATVRKRYSRALAKLRRLLKDVIT